MKRKVLLVLFCVLYASIAFVSTYHAFAFFALANPMWLSVILAVAFEVGQATVLFTLLASSVKNERQIMAWVLMGVLTAVQVIGNVFSSYKYMIINNADQIQYFTKSVLFFVQSPNPDYNYVMISYITGAILPVVALCMTSMIVKVMGSKDTPTVAVEESVVTDAPTQEVVEQSTGGESNVENETVKDAPVRTPRQKKLFN